jgi:AAA+ superfamily predicted ATPase
MTPNLTRLISDILHLPDDALVYEASRRLHDLYPDKFILETEDCDFDLQDYVAAGKCMIHLLDDAFGHVDATWSSSRGVGFTPKNALAEIQWRGIRMHCLTITYGDAKRHFVIADKRHEAIDFFKTVCTLEVNPQGEILVFRDGSWQRDAELKRQIATATLDDVVMPQSMRDDLIRDVERFFGSRELYDNHRLAWKRGLLFLGNPGNGKTLTIKGLVNRAGVPCLYVRSLEGYRVSIDWSIATVFKRARSASPCILVLEDLDSLVEEDNLSTLLNEMDGFAANRGILTIATTNHPDKLDPALLHRPSRFDRKIEFMDPALDERRRFLELANEKRDAAMRLAEQELDAAAHATEGFSFAFLKELNLAAMTACLIDGKPIAHAMRDAVASLKKEVLPA